MGPFADSQLLKNIQRIVAVFLCTLNGWPVSTMRLTLMRVGAASSRLPLPTRCGIWLAPTPRWSWPISPSSRRSRSSTAGTLAPPNVTGASTVPTLTAPEPPRRKREKRCTLFVPREPLFAGLCSLQIGLTRRRRGPRQSTSGSCRRVRG